jgi:hypothetical protein
MTTSKEQPPEIWEFIPVDSDQIRELAVAISNKAALFEHDELAQLLITLIAGLCASCNCSGVKECDCAVEDLAWHAMFQFFTATHKFNGSFFDYVVHDIKIARDYRREGER